MERKHVIVISSINQDMSLTVEALPTGGETVLAHSMNQSLGGKGANTAVAAAKSQLAKRVHLVAAVGRDGGALLGTLQHHAVDVSQVSVLERGTTGMAVVLVEARTGENMVVVVPAANHALSAACLGRIHHLLPRAVVVLHLEIARQVAEQAAEVAHSNGAMVVFNASPLPTPACVARSTSAALWRHADVLVVNQHELQQLSNAALRVDDDASDTAVTAMCARAINALWTRDAPRARAVVGTLGARGAVMKMGDDEAQLVRAPKPPSVVDTTGAGDTFTGYLAAALCAGKPLAAAVRTAVAAATLSVARRGAADGVPDRAAVDALLHTASAWL
ncbi:unnamed protein product [Agarophyton chilense]